MTKSTDAYNRSVLEHARAWLREPLVHFVLLGALVFVVHRAVFGGAPSSRVTRRDAPLEQLRQDWFAARGALPSAVEEATLVQEWMDEEVLYRRAIELGLDQNDTVVRRRLVQRMRFLIEDTHRIEPPTEDELESWLEEHPQRFADPPTISFTHRFFSRGKHGAELFAVARVALERMQDDPTAAIDDDPFFRGTDFEDVKPAEVERAFGAEFEEALVDLPLERWAGPVRSAYGLHLVHVSERAAPEAPTLATVREKVERDWMQAERDQRNRNALAKLRARYSAEAAP